MMDNDELEAKRQRLVEMDWYLYIYDPEVNNPPTRNDVPEYAKEPKRWYVAPRHFSGTFQAKLRYSESEALDDVPPATGDETPKS